MYDNLMDKEVIDLCDALNKLPGIITTESCSGHGKDTFKIWFHVDGRIDPKMKGLFFLTRCVDRRYWQHGHVWAITLSVSDTYDNGILPTMFCLESIAVGDHAYAQAIDLIENMKHHLNHDGFKNAFDIDLKDFGRLYKRRLNLNTSEVTYGFLPKDDQ